MHHTPATTSLLQDKLKLIILVMQSVSLLAVVENLSHTLLYDDMTPYTVIGERMNARHQ